MATLLDEIGQTAKAAGLAVYGGFHPGSEDGAPAGAATIVMLGYSGPDMWRHFSAAPEAGDGAPDPLDRWSRRVIEAIADDLGCAAAFPFGGSPYPPFLRWAAKAAPVWPSPLGMMIHADYGLWASWRGALVFREVLPLGGRSPAVRPCDTCRDRPCLAACPVKAFTADGYDDAACIDHIASAEGDDCMARGCLARRACPIGRSLAHVPAQAAFHMGAFLTAGRRRYPPK
ncbi:MAG: hypothetical protein KDJ16_03560 [Hyphomicrobiales bacterium]|nr:hypothetical protein [Hyphomicrobiales bacterium]